MTKVSSAASGISQLPSTPQNTIKVERFRSRERSFVNIHGSNEQLEKNAEKTDANDVTQEGREAGTRNVNGRTCSTIVDCVIFDGMDADGKWEAVKMNKLCARCLTSHSRWPCKGEICGINGCPKRHHRSLHFEPMIVANNHNDGSD